MLGAARKDRQIAVFEKVGTDLVIVSPKPLSLAWRLLCSKPSIRAAGAGYRPRVDRVYLHPRTRTLTGITSRSPDRGRSLQTFQVAHRY